VKRILQCKKKRGSTVERLASPQMGLAFGDGIVMDYFAGGGGASEGIEWAMGRPVDIAINHNKIALAMHKANHRLTRHYHSDVWEVDPRIATRGRPVDLVWFSPDCKHFSRAKGAKPVEKNIRGLAWVKVKVAATVRPSIAITENVPEFLDWGPLIQKIDKDGKPAYKDSQPVQVPDPLRKGETFKVWVKALVDLGYKVEWKLLKACDYGAPTTRKRLFVVARCDGKPIQWPEVTHGSTTDLKPFRTAAECIDWTIPSYSIFLTKDEAKEFNVRRPLAINTLKRIARGIQKFVINNPDPFVISYYGLKKSGEFRGIELGQPLPTQTTENRFGLVTPYFARVGHRRVNGERLPLPLDKQHSKVITTALSPFMVPRYGERQGQEPRCHSIESPMQTITTTANNGSVVTECLARQFNNSTGHQLGMQSNAVCGGEAQKMSAFLAKHYTGVDGQVLNKPIGTITAIDHHSLIASHLIKLGGSCPPPTALEFTINDECSNDGELRTLLTSNGKLVLGSLSVLSEEQRYMAWWIVRFLEDYTDQQADIYLRPRTAAIVVGEYVIVDIGLRMLAPKELFKAQGFNDDYIHDRDDVGNKITATNQVKMCGNSVSPYVARALVEANYGVSFIDDKRVVI